MSTQRMRWALPRVLSVKFHQQLNAKLYNPRTFYLSMLLKLVPSLYNRPLTLRLKDGKILRVRSFMTLYIFEEIFLRGVYDVESKGVASIIDMGANTGLFVLRAKQCWPNAKIVAFEPEPTNYAALCETIENNDLRGVKAINAAIAAVRGPTTLYRHPRNVGAHSTVHRYSQDSVQVTCQTVSDALALLPNERCDLMKVDCEGAEESIFRSLNADTAGRIGMIIYEPDRGYSADELNKWLKTFGFTVSAYKGNFIARQPWSQ
jgi:FkbM family methyltransferase